MVYTENCANQLHFSEHTAAVAVGAVAVEVAAVGAVAFGAVYFYVFSIFRLVDWDGRIRGDLASCLC